MKAKKRIIISIIVFMLFGISILFFMYLKKPSLNVSELIEKENISDLSLTIYYMSPYTLTYIPVSSVEDLISQCDEKIVINGSELEEHIDLFKQINNDVLVPVKKKTKDLNLRIYYILESKKNGKLFDAAMWGEEDDEESIIVNEFEVKGNNIFYDVIIPFLPEDKAKELEKFIRDGFVLSDAYLQA